MVKAADALADDGHDVTLISTTGWIRWATETDAAVAVSRTCKWTWLTVNWNRRGAFFVWLWSGVRFRLCRWLFRVMPQLSYTPLILGNAHVRITNELKRKAEERNCDLFYGGGSALSATALAADARGVPFALDLEDFHSEEVDREVDSGLGTRIVQEVERRTLRRALFLTTSSSDISEAYRDKYGVTPAVIHNVFPIPEQPPFAARRATDPFQMYWFSQTIGRQRGLEDAVAGAGLLSVPVELYLRGNADGAYIDALTTLAKRVAPNLRIIFHPPAPPDQMIALARGYHVGLALEHPHVKNRDICLTNKAFIYMLAGLAIVVTQTKAQTRLAATLSTAAVSYSPGDATGFATSIKPWVENPNLLLQAQHASWRAGYTRWHWEHPEERDKLLRLVSSVSK